MAAGESTEILCAGDVNFSTVRACVFDVGGVFRDSKKATLQCFRDAFANCGVWDTHPFEVTEDAYYIRGTATFNNLKAATEAILATEGNLGPFVGETEGELRLLAHVAAQKEKGNLEDTLVMNIVAEYKRLFALPETKDLVRLAPGSESALKLLRDNGFTLGVLSNGSEAALKRDLGHLFQYFSFTLAEAEKPNTDKYLLALSKTGVAPEETMYIGDAASDVLMAKRAKSTSIAVLSGMGSRSLLENARPAAIFTDVQVFATWLVRNTSPQ